MRVHFCGKSDVGRRRQTNEDAYIVSPEQGYCVLADGMGGHQAGEVASQMAVEIMSKHLGGSGPNISGYRSRRKSEQLKAMVTDLIEDWTQKVNAAIYDRGSETTNIKRRMGTTFALFYVLGDFAVIAHVGDSRVYRLRNQVLQRLTQDHSIITHQARMGQRVRKKKYITRALGTRPDVEPDIHLHDVRDGDIFVICSDGLTDMVTDGEIRRTLLRCGADLAQAVDDLVQLANIKGGRDNITVILGRCIDERLDELDDEEEDECADTETIAYLVKESEEEK